MVDRVLLHIGLPKTATSYLQTIVWSNREALREAGVVVPGRERRDHLWASRVVREDPHLHRHPEHHATAWRRLVDELAEAPGTGLVSHEFFAAASGRQAREAVAALAPAEVHVVLTAREPLGLFTASWQESLKNGGTRPMADYGRSESRSPEAIWDWRTLDLSLVLGRWAKAVPPERIHVLPLDPSAAREEIWHRFAALLGVDPRAFDLSRSFPNASMGVVEAETLRRVNLSLQGSDHPFERAFDKGVYLRTFLADERLVPRAGEKFWPEPDQVEDCRARGRRAVDLLDRGGFVVHGDARHLLVPDELEPRRVPASVTDSEVARVAVDLVGTLLDDVRTLRSEPQGSGPASEAGSARGVRAGARHLWRRSRLSRRRAGG
ncbi:hypothetical protein [Nocardioides solisilvae]|uniref:hypothetical protein n=1 Tax=Nocardioides solisilvae TaxID=1542435 RepID=UPI000D7414E1|nr:hypothetical protein [Nocardioides solisilvae]